MHIVIHTQCADRPLPPHPIHPCTTNKKIRRPLQALLEQQHSQHARIKLDWNRVVKEFYARREALGKVIKGCGCGCGVD